MLQKTFFIFTISFLIVTHCKLTVRSKTGNFSERFDKVNGLDYAVLNAQSESTYKRSFIGNAILSNPIDACEKVKPIDTLGDQAVTNPVLVAQWGECHYAQKVKNAEIAGAKMLILVLKHEMPLNHVAIKQLPMSSSVEVLVIGAEDGQKLIEYLTPKDNFIPAIDIIYSYNPENQINYQSGDKVTLDFWFVAADISKQSYEFLYDLRELIADFGDRVKFTPHYVLWRNDVLVQERSSVKDYRCIAGGLYCDPEPETDYQIFGSKGVVENLRQLCMWKRDEGQSLWWKYVIGFGTKCVDLERAKLDDCRQEVYDEHSISKDVVLEVEDCMRKSFENFSGVNVEETTWDNVNEMLDMELSLKEQLHIDHYPALYVNKERYQDTFRNRFVVQDFVCAHFLKESSPYMCKEQIWVEAPIKQSDYMTYAGLIVVCIVIMAVMLYCVRRTVKRQVMGRMNEEISHIVTQYKQFKDKSDTHEDDL